MDISCYSSNMYIVMTLLSSKLYNILTSDFSFFMFPSNAVPIKVGCTLNAIFDPLTKAVNIIFPNILQPSYLVLVLHESQITSFLSNCSTFPLHFGQLFFHLKNLILPVTSAWFKSFKSPLSTISSLSAFWIVDISVLSRSLLVIYFETLKSVKINIPGSSSLSTSSPNTVSVAFLKQNSFFGFFHSRDSTDVTHQPSYISNITKLCLVFNVCHWYKWMPFFFPVKHWFCFTNKGIVTNNA